MFEYYTQTKSVWESSFVQYKNMLKFILKYPKRAAC